MLQEGLQQFFHISSFLAINLGIFLGMIFGAIPGLTVVLCIVLFLPFTYSLGAIPSFMFLLGIYCAGSYGGSISAILIRIPGTPHATATMQDGAPLAERGQAHKALYVALLASTFGGLFSALVLLFLAPQVSLLAQKIGTPEYFWVCAFGLTIIGSLSGKSLATGLLSGLLGLFLATIGLDPMTSNTRFIFQNVNLYSGFDLVVSLIGLFALCGFLQNHLTTPQNPSQISKSSSRLPEKKYADNAQEPSYTVEVATGRIKASLSLKEYQKIALPSFISAVIGIIIGIIPGTGATMASFISYDRAKKMSKTPEEFGKGSIEGIAAAETANNAVTGATLIPLLTLGIPGDASVAIMLGALMINGLTPGPQLFVEHGATMYAIMLGLIFVNLFMFLQGKYLMAIFAKVIRIPKSILFPLIVMFCFAGTYSLKASMFDVYTAIAFAILAYLFHKLDIPIVPLLLGLILGSITEENFRRSLILSDGSWSIFVNSPINIVFILAIIFSVFFIIKSKLHNLE